MKSQASPILGILLGISALLNVVLLTRAKDPTPPAPAAPRPRPYTPEIRESTVDRPAAAPLAPALVPAPSEAAAAPVPEVRRGPGAPRPSSIPLDPSVEAVLDAQDRFGTFWRDLDRIIKAKDRLESTKFFNTVVQATMDFLEMPEGQRPLFSQAVQDGVAGMARARQERDAARKALPPKDKNDVAGYAFYTQQKDAIDARYVAQTKACTDAIAARLSPDKPRHAEFAARTDSWLRNLIPKQVP